MTAMRHKVVFVGCGDIAQRAARQLNEGEFQLVGLRRNVDQLPEFIEPLAIDLDASTDLAPLHNIAPEVVVITLTPNERSEAGYQRCYVTNLQKIINALQQAQTKPRLVIFVSSTSVYGQNSGEWVDENSVTEPSEFNGRAILRGEQLLKDSKLPHGILRFSGIYGPGRTRLIEQVKNNEWSENDASLWTNRIHADDGAGFIAHLIQKKCRGEEVDSLFVVSDNQPVLLHDVKQWLAEKMKQPCANFQVENKQFTGKRCLNKKMLASGYHLIFENYKQGYAGLIGII